MRSHRVRLRENPPRNSRKRTHTMALDQSALLELAEMVQRADGGDLMRKLLETMLQLTASASKGLAAMALA